MTRARDLGITIGTFPPGTHNAITDVPGVRVGHKTVIRDTRGASTELRVRTGVTVITAREGRLHEDHPLAGCFSFNGCGEMTGVAWIEESSLHASPIALTTTVCSSASIPHPQHPRAFPYGCIADFCHGH